MIKRPLVWMTVAFVLGICMGDEGFRALRVIFLVCFLVVLTIASAFIPGFLKKEYFLWILPALFIVGGARYRAETAPTPLEAYFDGESKIVAEGIVAEVTVYEDYVRLWVKKAHVKGFKEPEAGDCEYTELPGCYGLLAYTEEEIKPGYRVQMTGTVQELNRAENPGQYDEESYWSAKGVCARINAEEVKTGEDTYGMIKRWIAERRIQISEGIEAALPAKEAGIIKAMLLADKGALDEDTRTLYQKTGLSHVLAVSGMHFSLLAMGCYQLLRKIKAGAKLSLVAGCLLVVFYGLLTGFGVSVQRAAIMLLMSFLAWLPGKTYDAPTALSLSAVVILVQQPLQLFQAGFLLSFGAVLGILLFTDYFQKCRLGWIGASAATQLVLIPVLLWFFYEVPVYALLFNLVLLPFMSLLLVLAVLIGVGALFFPAAAGFFAGGAYYMLQFYEWVCRLNEYLPGNMFCYGRPEKWELAAYYGLLLGFVILCRRLPKKRSLLYLAVFSVFLLPGRKDVMVSYLAVGQGDCAVIQSGTMTVLVDAGGSVKNGAERILIPFLQYHGDTQVEYVFLSHADNDHYCMLSELFEQMEAGECEIVLERLVMPAAGEDEEKYIQLVAQAEKAGVKVLYMARGDMLKLTGMEIYCLAPERAQDGLGTNENSSCLLVETAGCRYLFTGDMDAAAEREMLAWLASVDTVQMSGSHILAEKEPMSEKKRTTILKVAHHGSRYSSSTELLGWLRPEYAVISCSETNRYGHPHAETQERLKEAGAQQYITWESGAVLVRENERGVEVTEYRKH